MGIYQPPKMKSSILDEIVQTNTWALAGFHLLAEVFQENIDDILGEREIDLATDLMQVEKAGRAKSDSSKALPYYPVEWNRMLSAYGIVADSVTKYCYARIHFTHHDLFKKRKKPQYSEEIRSSGETPKDFIKKKMPQVGMKDTISLGQIYEHNKLSYKTYCKNNNTKAVGINEFLKKIQELGAGYICDDTGYDVVRQFTGIRFTDAERGAAVDPAYSMSGTEEEEDDEEQATALDRTHNIKKSSFHAPEASHANDDEDAEFVEDEDVAQDLALRLENVALEDSEREDGEFFLDEQNRPEPNCPEPEVPDTTKEIQYNNVSLWMETNGTYQLWNEKYECIGHATEFYNEDQIKTIEFYEGFETSITEHPDYKAPALPSMPSLPSF